MRPRVFHAYVSAIGVVPRILNWKTTMNLSFSPADESNPLFGFLAEHFRPSELDALIEAILAENDETDAERLDLLQSVRETFGPPTPAEDAGGPENQGMQWLVVGMVPGPLQFLVGTDTRAQALDAMGEQANLKDFEYVAVVKARDFFILPHL